jgi:KRAB domain-containing zinc finger protein
VCKKRFSQWSHLVRHINATHKGFSNPRKLAGQYKSYECDVCNKQLSVSCNLKTHKRTHSGNKPYECDVCDRNLKNLMYWERKQFSLNCE